MTKKILILAANPKDTSRLRLDQEVREIDNGLQRARRRDEFILEQVWAVRRADFRRAMLDLKPNIYRLQPGFLIALVLQARALNRAMGIIGMLLINERKSA